MRPRHPMPAEIAERLESAGVRADYDARPAYQRNDYLGWIAQAKQPETGEKRIAIMIDELERGVIYMGMTHKPSKKG